MKKLIILMAAVAIGCCLLVSIILIESSQIVLHIVGQHFAVAGGKYQHLVAAMLHGTALVYVDMPRVG